MFSQFLCVCSSFSLHTRKEKILCKIPRLTSTGEGSSNNYAYLVVDDKSKDAVIIDPANPPEYAEPIFNYLPRAG